ncbi:hypothetical protein PG991_008473 [Apiospora marii]|uniref:Azaphilone pigments biosynthesis cluster protein L N-terminal domain-containing protein n=1 Tax=Apiospora marii TaxID=335849 RepID=A0ABR1RKV8_9PEZI
MADSLNITTSVNAVVTAVYTSCKTLEDTIDTIDRAPETLQNLRHDLRVLQGSLMSLKVALETMSTSKEELSPHQHTCLSELEPAILGCQTALDGFEYKISHIKSVSADEHAHWVDKACLPYHDKDVILLKSRLGDCKQTLDVAIGIMALQINRHALELRTETNGSRRKSIWEDQEKLQLLEAQTATTLGNLTGKVEVLDLVAQTLSQPGQAVELAAQTAKYVGHVIADQHIAQVVTMLHEHEELLKHCIKVCAVALSGATAETGARVKYAKAFSDAGRWVGNVGDIGTGDLFVEIGHPETRDIRASLGIGSKFKQAALEIFRR